MAMYIQYRLIRQTLGCITLAFLLAGCWGADSSPVTPPSRATQDVARTAAAATPIGLEPFFSMDLGASHTAFSSANALVWLPDNHFAVAAQEKVALVNAAAAQTTSQELPVLQAAQPSSAARFLTASLSGDELAWVSADTQIQFWRPEESLSAQALTASDTPVTGLAFSPGGEQLAFANLDGDIVGLDAQSQAKSFAWQAPNWLSNLSISPDGSQLGGVDLSNFLVYIYTLDGNIVKTLEWSEHASPALYSANFSPDWSRIAWVARGTVQLMEVGTGELGPQISHEDFVIACVWSPDSRRLATAAPVFDDDQLKMGVFVWDPQSGEEVQRIMLESTIKSLTFSPDGKQMAALEENGLLKVFDISQ
jgi:WD40 repeat protein